jgi:NAD(P)H dehydrogenase (quinone)
MMSNNSPILIAGAAGNVATSVIEILRECELPVRALVHRLDDRSQALIDMGAEVVAADLTNGADMARALNGCQRMYFGMSVSPSYLQATVIAAAAAKEISNLEVFVNISQMTVSQMSLTNMTDSPQQQQHWLGEQVLNWSGLPVVHVRSTVFLEHPFFSILAPASIAKNGTIRLPFGKGRTSPISAYDVARVIAVILQNPAPHIGKVYELTGPHSLDMDAIAKEYEKALNRPVKYIDVPFDIWRDQDLRSLELPEHLFHHLLIMTQLHAENRYDRLTNDVAKITGKPSMSIQEYVASHTEIFNVNK